MNNTKKLLLLLFTVAMVVNLQFNTPLTHNMDNGFSIEQLAENIFVPEVYASFPGLNPCRVIHPECGGSSWDPCGIFYPPPPNQPRMCFWDLF